MSAHLPSAEFLFELDVTCDAPQLLGTKLGARMMMIPITGGTITGPAFSGSVMPGGADWAVVHSDGTTQVDARYAIQATDGTIIQVFNTSTMRMEQGGGAMPPVITSPRFIAPEGSYDWLNYGVYVGTLHVDPSGPGGGVRVRVFRMN
jgi:Protein of unknown function (DUF3237)